jgi:ribonuclease G
MQITRQRVRPEINIKTKETCPSCKGTGKVESTLLITDDIERNLKYILQSHAFVEIETHPFVEAYINRGIWSLRRKWLWKYKRKIKIKANNNLPLMSFRFFDKEGGRIKI